MMRKGPSGPPTRGEDDSGLRSRIRHPHPPSGEFRPRRSPLTTPMPFPMHIGILPNPWMMKKAMRGMGVRTSTPRVLRTTSRVISVGNVGSFNAKHPRWPKGSRLGGKFRGK